MRLCRFSFCRIKSFTREDKIVVCALFIWALVLGLIIGLVVSLNTNSSKYKKRSSAMKKSQNNNFDDFDIKLEKSPKEENPVVITSTLYEAGHKMPLNDAKKSQNNNFDDFQITQFTITSDSKLEKSPEEENPVVITSTLYEAGHKMPLNDICPNQGEGMKLLILVMSSPKHASQRNTIRSTWGSVAFRRDIGLAFMLGISKKSLVNEHIERENRLYGDIIQGMFIDTYNNLTLKTISTLEWSWTHCSRVKFVLKTDDDVYIHTPVLLDILDRVKNRSQTIMGYFARGWKPVRDTKSHYYISKNQFQENKFPNFHTGPAYVLTSDIVEQLYRAALNEPFFKLEDVYITGIIANNQSNIQHLHYPQFLNSRPKKSEMLNTCVMAKLAAVHEIRKEEMFDLWRRLSDGLSNC